MTRTQLWILNFALAAAVIAAAWWAVNAARVAAPSPTPLGAVDLPTERPPVPPAPFRRAPSDSPDGVGRRDVFAASPARRSDAPATRAEAPAAAGVVAPNAAAPTRDSLGERQRPSQDDPFRFAEGIEKPSYEQYAGAHLIPPEQRESDRAGVVPAGEPGNAPLYAARPRINPRRAPAGGADAAPQDVAAGTPEAVEPTESSLAAGAVDGFILLGVFRSSGEDRALVRKPDGESVRVVQGDEIEGWRVADIGDEFVELRRASQTRLLRLPE